jgi:endonuclease/exonuclease/phosphatase (EEP) superfamily protein YafD
VVSKVARGLAVGLVAAILVFAALLTVCRLIDVNAPRAVVLESFAPLAIPLYLLGLLFLWLLVRAEYRLRIAAKAVTVVVAVALGLQISWMVPFYFGSVPAAKPGTDLIVLSSNVYVGAANMSDIYDAVLKDKVNILVLLEATKHDMTQLDKLGIKKALPYQAGAPGGFARGTVVYADKKLTGQVPIATAHDSWRLVYGGKLQFFAVHPAAPTDPDLWRHDLSAITDAALKRKPDLIVGDFNSTNDHKPMRDLEGDGWRDAAELSNSGWQPTWPANGLGPAFMPPLSQIDHALIGKGYTALKVSTLDIRDTDHKAILVHMAKAA